MSTPKSLPFLPGCSFSSPQDRASLRRGQTLTFENKLPIVDSDKASAAQRPTANVFPTAGGAAQLPAWIAFDRQVLRFEGYFTELVPERREEQLRVRKCKLLYYLEDDTIQVNEPAQENSGIPQGTLIRRHRIPKPAPQDDQFYTVIDLNLGVELNLYARIIRLVKCDKFSENFITKLGVRLNEPEDYPSDSYSELRNTQKKTVAPKRPYEKVDTRGQFLEHDRQVLRFFALWDDTSSESGDVHKLVVLYYLADDTIEVLEVIAPNSGRDAPSVFLKRQKLPRSTPAMPLPGQRTARTVLNVFGPSTSGGRHLLDSLKTGAYEPEFYFENELQIGATLNVFGRAILLCDLDEFTKTYYNVKYSVQDFTPIPFPESPKKAVPREVPPYNGFGTEEDSLANCTRLIPKPVQKDLSKFWNKDTHELESEELRFMARLDTTKPIDLDRRFLVTYSVVPDTLSIYEPQQRNSGIATGKFLQEGKYKLPDGSRYFDAKDLYVGARIEVNKFKFVLIDADEYAFHYMEKHDFPFSNVDNILEKLKPSLQGKRAELTEALGKADVGSKNRVPIPRFTLILNRLADCQLNEHEIRTLVQNFSGVTQPRFSKQFIAATKATLQLRNDTKFAHIADAFRFHDKDHNGFLDKEELRAVCFEYNIPISSEMIDKLYAAVDPTNDGKVDFTAFSKFLDWRGQGYEGTRSINAFETACSSPLADLTSDSYLTTQGDELAKVWMRRFWRGPAHRPSEPPVHLHRAACRRSRSGHFCASLPQGAL